jgi:hypothetical protein
VFFNQRAAILYCFHPARLLRFPYPLARFFLRPILAQGAFFSSQVSATTGSRNFSDEKRYPLCYNKFRIEWIRIFRFLWAGRASWDQ